MEDARKLKFYLIILISLLVVASSIWLYHFTSLSPTQAVPLEDCKTLTNPGGSIGLLFFSTKDQAQEYSSYLLDKAPFNTHKGDFAVRYIDTITPDCQLYQGKATLCYSKKLIQEAASCPYSYIFVANAQESSIRSSSYMGVMSINTNHPLSVLLHEFGHAFANFAEEYAPASIPRGSKNCASSCNQFGDTQSCFKECSDSSHFRSTENGIMRTLDSESYGAYDDNLVESKIKSSAKSTLSGNAISDTTDCSKQQYLLVEATYDATNDAIKVINKELKQGCPATTDSGPFKYQVFSTSGISAQSTFNPEPIFTDAPAQTNLVGETYTNKDSFYLSLPATTLENTNTVEFLDENNNNIGSLNLQDLNSRPCEI